jgi:hypothetical protein
MNPQQATAKENGFLAEWVHAWRALATPSPSVGKSKGTQ